MSALIIATGSNLGHKLEHLNNAKLELCRHYQLVAESRIYQSQAVDYKQQPSFYNQVLQFQLPETSAKEVLNKLLSIENKLGRLRDIPKGPRTIDIDLLFYDLYQCTSEALELPHPRLWQRSFVVLPLKELPFFRTLEKKFIFQQAFETPAYPLTAQTEMS